MNKYFLRRNISNFFLLSFIWAVIAYSNSAVKAASFQLTLNLVAQQNEQFDAPVTGVLINAIKLEGDKKLSAGSFLSEREELIPFERDGRWGYRDRKGKIIVPAQFAIAQNFSRQGIAAVVDEQGSAYIDQMGRVIIRPFSFDNGPDYFKEGLARFNLNGKLGFFDKTGKIIIKAQFDFAEPFHDGLAAVCIGCRSEIIDHGEHSVMVGGLWGYINQRNRIIVPLKFRAQKVLIIKEGVSN